MGRHNHYNIICKKAANMDLVLLANGAGNAEDNDWFEYGNDGDYFPTLYSECEYFLCLPQHKEACLHWLNGGEIRYRKQGKLVKYDLSIGDLKHSLEDFTGLEFDFVIIV